jgi:hypothetical protein
VGNNTYVPTEFFLTQSNANPKETVVQNLQAFVFNLEDAFTGASAVLTPSQLAILSNLTAIHVPAGVVYLRKLDLSTTSIAGGAFRPLREHHQCVVPKHCQHQLCVLAQCWITIDAGNVDVDEFIVDANHTCDPNADLAANLAQAPRAAAVHFVGNCRISCRFWSASGTNPIPIRAHVFVTNVCPDFGQRKGGSGAANVKDDRLVDGSAHYFHFLSLQLISSLIFVMSGVAFKLKLFALTQPFVYVLVVFLWANTMVALSLLLSLFFNRSRLASNVTFVIVLFFAIINSSAQINFSYEFPPLWWFINPLFAFFSALDELGSASGSSFRPPYRVADLTIGDPAVTTMLCLFFECLLFLGLVAYLNNVLPSEYGVQKPWYYPFTDAYEYVQSRWLTEYLPPLKSTLTKEAKTCEQEQDWFTIDKLGEIEDDDVQAERKRVNEMSIGPEVFDKYPFSCAILAKRTLMERWPIALYAWPSSVTVFLVCLDRTGAVKRR